MTLQLSSYDQVQLGDAIDALLSPLDYPDLDTWRSTVNTRVRELLGGDQAAFQLPLEGITEIYSDEYSGIDRVQYLDMMSTLTETVPFWARTQHLGVYNREQAWQPHLDLYYSSAYYNEFVVPIRSFDVIGLATPISNASGWKGTANLLVSHESEDGPLFGERGLALLHLLFPAFKAGIQTYVRLSQYQSTLIRSLDATTQGILLCTADGRTVHINTALVAILDDAPERDELLQSLNMLALRLANLRTAAEKACLAGQTPLEHCVRTVRGEYRLVGSFLGEDGTSPFGYVVVTIEKVPATPPKPFQLRERFGLTNREAQIAILLAQRKRNEEIADDLSISPHTARHHTEQILSKLGIHSRHDVWSTISDQ